MVDTKVGRGTLLSTGSAFWAAAFLIPYKQASLIADAQAVALVMLAASAIMNTVAAATELRGKLRLDRLSLLTAVALAGFSVVGNFCSAMALLTLEPAIASVLYRTQIVFVAVAGVFALGEGITRTFALGAGVALAGLVVMQLPETGLAEFGSSAAGVLWALGASASFASMAVITRRVIHRIRPIAVNAVRLWLAVAVLALVPGTAQSALDADPRMWLFASLAAACGPFVSRLLIMFALRYITAAYQTLVSLSSPLFAFVLGFVFMGSIPSAQEILGGAVMLLGIAVVVVSSARTGRRRLAQ